MTLKSRSQSRQAREINLRCKKCGDGRFFRLTPNPFSKQHKNENKFLCFRWPTDAFEEQQGRTFIC